MVKNVSHGGGMKYKKIPTSCFICNQPSTTKFNVENRFSVKGLREYVPRIPNNIYICHCIECNDKLNEKIMNLFIEALHDGAFD
ncbi:MAG: hypothetical protein ACTSXD_04735 [Candidatus Heimdallarchaeaceae archaeon]